MSTFSSLATLVHRIHSRKKNLARNKHIQVSEAIDADHFIPLPKALSDRIPQELFERFIDHLYGDKRALSTCSTVCRAWFTTSRYYLFRPLIVRPLRLGHGFFGSINNVNCAVALRGRNNILYGTDEGIFYSHLNRGAVPIKVLSLSYVSQIDVLQDHNLLVILSGHQVLTVSLSILTATQPRGFAACSRVSSGASFFKVGVILGRTLVCIVKSGLSSATFKVMEPVASLGPQVNSHLSLKLYKEFYIHAKILSVDFLRTKLVAGTSGHGFEVINIESLVTQELLAPGSHIPIEKTTKCLAVYRIGEEHLLCYDAFAAYVDSRGQLSRSNFIRWENTQILAFALHEPYILAFGHSYVEVRHVETGALMQIIRGPIKLLSTSSELFIIQTEDGRVIGLDFLD